MMLANNVRMENLLLSFRRLNLAGLDDWDQKVMDNCCS